MALTLGELLDHPAFGLELRTSDESARTRPIHGVHYLELLDPVRWLQDGWVMLTAGAQLREGEASQRLLIERLADSGIVALGFGVGAFVPDIPEALLDEAERRAFPVFRSPYETPFREIVTYVNQSLLSHDIYVLRRLTWMQQYLLDALHEPAAEQVLLERLGAVMGDASALYADAGGRVVASAGAPPEWGEVAALCDPRGTAEAELDGRWVAVTPVLGGSVPEGWVVVAGRGRPLDRQLSRPLLQTANNLLALLLSTRRAAVRSRLDLRQRVAVRALRAARGEPDGGLGGSLAGEGIDFTGPCRVAIGAVRAPTSPAGWDGDAALAAFDAYALVHGVDAIATTERQRAVMIVQHDLAGLEDWLGARGGAPMAVGVSEAFGAVDELAAAVEQAELAMSAAASGGVAQAVVRRYEDLDPEVLLVGEIRTPEVRARLASFLRPIEDQPRLLEAVQAYLAADLDVGAAAAALHLHRNSLRNRLLRAEELLGRQLKSSATIAALHLALIARNVGPREPDEPHAPVGESSPDDRDEGAWSG